ncbi:MAG: hypothetical protein ACK5RT_01580 [Dolichospermum sp.]
MIPVARTANVLITEVDNEVMIYDRERDDCHCLNPIATKVYYYADGRNTVDDIATFLEQELELSEDLDIRGLVWLALEELEKCDLIKEYLREPLPNVLKMSRRKVLGKTTKFAGAVAIGTLFPMIQSVIAPKPAFAASTPTPTPTPTPCPRSSKVRGSAVGDTAGASVAACNDAKMACTSYLCEPCRAVPGACSDPIIVDIAGKLSTIVSVSCHCV